MAADRLTHVWQQQLNTALQQLAWMTIDMNDVAMIYYEYDVICKYLTRSIYSSAKS